ncbi:hypothetical protein KI387_001171, partial [Taxus chinensis]
MVPGLTISHMRRIEPRPRGVRDPRGVQPQPDGSVTGRRREAAQGPAGRQAEG